VWAKNRIIVHFSFTCIGFFGETEKFWAPGNLAIATQTLVDILGKRRLNGNLSRYLERGLNIEKSLSSVVSLLRADNYSSPVLSPRIGSISPSSARTSGSQSLVKSGSAASEHTWPASSHDHDPRQPLTTLETAAMAARETSTPHAGSTRGPSALLSSPVWKVATVWRSPCHSWAQVAATADVSRHVVTRSCGRLGTAPTAGVCRPHPYTAW
jgi:hypothetical protein